MKLNMMMNTRHVMQKRSVDCWLENVLNVKNSSVIQKYVQTVKTTTAITMGILEHDNVLRGM